MQQSQRSLHKKMKFSVKDFFSKCDQIRGKLRIWSHLLKKSLVKNFIFCTVDIRSRIHRIISNIYFSSEQKKLKDSVRKDSVKDFKQRQRERQKTH